MNPESILELLKQVPYPGFSRDIVSFGLVKDVQIDAGIVTVLISIQTKDPTVPEQIFNNCHAVLDPVPEIKHAKIEIDVQEPSTQAGSAEGQEKSNIPGVKKIIAVASGKGGVGKSTVASNLAVALSKTGAKVGLCDCDLCGPSITLMFGKNERPLATEDNQIIPITAHDVKLMSMGFLLEDDSPVIVRGPLATRYTQQFLTHVLWGDLDYLILDLPPGTGDIQLTIVQTIALTGAIIVTTPQEVALIDARKAVSMFDKVNVPILGLIENMAWFECDHGTRYPIFGEGGGAREAEKLKVPLLGQIPINIPTRQQGDSGQPIALSDPSANPTSAAFADIAKSVLLLG
ncbi:Mrp/NBP35 family ATP-binding protein [Verrucomicrobiaceae bacterium N1E253]|uniref:Iron-sulfur cluster carrier protein n=1 Tax=Oceaniferula marina TaxID=2748318 RepID=A0A851GHV4_9BACT|nr:P-loop NTPase [Oceaniferula marina]NWK56936.1 Mrp/NBP35 family ATP-binding protein [Oceaniferula marina]